MGFNRLAGAMGYCSNNSVNNLDALLNEKEYYEIISNDSSIIPYLNKYKWQVYSGQTTIFK